MLSGADKLSEAHQVCVVGAGPVGIAAALTLARSGVRTLLIDGGSGRPRAPGGYPYDLGSDMRRTHASDRQTLANGLGGTSSRWGGRCVQLDDIDFERRDYIGSVEWPISHDDIKDFYRDAAGILGCGIGSNGPDDRDDFFAAYESWAFPRNTAVVNRVELEASPSIHVVLETNIVEMCLDREKGRITSLRVMRKGRPHTVQAENFVLACGGRANARLLLNLQADAAELFGGRNGPLGRYYMGHLTGQISKVRFRSHSVAESCLIRRHGKGYFSSTRLQPSPATQRSLRIQNVALWPHNSDVGTLPPISPAASAAFFREVMTGKRKIAWHTGLAHALSLARHPARGVASTVETLNAYYCDGLPFLQFRNPNNEYFLRYHSEQLPRAENRVRLIDRKDEHGQRLVEPSFDYCTQDCRSVVLAHQALDEWLQKRELGALSFDGGDLEALVASQASDGYHQIGLTRMGSNRHEGVVDANCQTFDIGNLFIAGSSVFVTSGQANPTLPAVAFGVRLARHISSLRGTALV